MMQSDMISRSALLEELRSRKMIELFPHKTLSAETWDALHTLGKAIGKVIEKVPTVTVDGIIHCKDCVHYGKSPFRHPTIGWCKMYGSHRRPDFFCGFAEKKVQE